MKAATTAHTRVYFDCPPWCTVPVEQHVREEAGVSDKPGAAIHWSAKRQLDTDDSSPLSLQLASSSNIDKPIVYLGEAELLPDQAQQVAHELLDMAAIADVPSNDNPPDATCDIYCPSWCAGRGPGGHDVDHHWRSVTETSGLVVTAVRRGRAWPVIEVDDMTGNRVQTVVVSAAVARSLAAALVRGAEMIESNP